MKVIDLLNKIANGEEVPHFIIDEQEYYLGADGFLKELYGDEVEWTLDTEWLNTEVEIIEEPKEIEELPMEKGDINDKTFLAKYITHNRYKINELVRKINELKKENK